MHTGNLGTRNREQQQQREETLPNDSPLGLARAGCLWPELEKRGKGADLTLTPPSAVVA